MRGMGLGWGDISVVSPRVLSPPPQEVERRPAALPGRHVLIEAPVKSTRSPACFWHMRR